MPNWTVQKNTSPEYRFLAIREPFRDQLTLTDLGAAQPSLPFPTMDFNQKRYKVFGLVTNRDLPGRIIKRAGALINRLTAAHSANAILLAARRRIMSLAQAPSG